MANQSITDYTLADLNAQRMVDEYHALPNDQARFDWLVDLSVVDNAAKSPLMEDQQEVLKELKEDFFNPKNAKGEPDHEIFAQRMDIFYEGIERSRMEVGRSALAEQSSGAWDRQDPALENKAYFSVLQGGAGERMSTVMSMFQTSIDHAYEKPYADRVGIRPLPPERENDTRRQRERFEAAWKTAGENARERYASSLSGEEKTAYEHYQKIDQATAQVSPKNVFSPEELRRVDAAGDASKDQMRAEAAQGKSVFDKNAEVKDALAQFNTKRSGIFLGRESKEHENLRTAAEDYQQKLKAFQDARGKSPQERYEAMRALDAATDRMQQMSEVYQREKGDPSTEAGRARLMGARNLQTIANEMRAQIAKDYPEYGKFKEEMAQLKSAQNLTPAVGSDTDMQIRSAIGALGLHEKNNWAGMDLCYDNPRINTVRNTAEAAAQVIALQSLYAEKPELFRRGVDHSSISQRMKSIQADPAFQKMMENYEKKPGALTDLARSNPNALRQELLETRAQMNTVKGGERTPVKPTGKPAYPEETINEIWAHGREYTGQAARAAREKGKGKTKAISAKDLEKKLGADKAPKKEVKRKPKENAAQKQKVKQGPGMGAK